MSKIVKIAAVVAGIALAIPTGGGSLLAVGLGISATAAAGLAIGLTVASSLLAKKPKAPATSDNAADRLQLSLDPRTPRKFVFGRTAMATDIRDQELSGTDQEYVHRFVVVASHACQAIEEIWFDDKQAWTSGGGVTSAFSGYLTVQTVLEGSSANAINISARMGSTRRYTGLAYVYLRYKLTGNTKKTTSPFQSSIPARVTIIGKGAKVYDPRLDSTVPGGSGSQRANDQTTWAWNDSASRNPALQLLWYLLGWRIRNPVTSEWRLAVGKGIPAARINLASFITAANLCDESVTKAAGGTEPRYRSDGVFSEGDAASTVIDQLKATMNAELDDVDGQLRLIVLHNDLAAPIADFSEDDVLDDFAWDQTASLDDTFNVVRGTYIDPSTNSLYQAVDYPEVRIDTPDGIDRIETVDLQLVQSPSQAQRLAKQRVARMLYSGVFSATFGHRAWKVQRGDVVRLSFAALGWTNKLFRVVDTAVQVDGQVPMTLREESADIYLWDMEEAPAVAAVAPTTYDPSKDALYTFILDASGLTVLLTNDSHTVPADADGTVTSYDGAEGDFVILAADGADIGPDFTLATAPGGNPQGLSVTYTGLHYEVTGGLDAGEEGASLIIRATGGGDYSGVTADKVFSLTKSVAGAAGETPPLIRLTTDFFTFDYDTAGAIKSRTITFKASRNAEATDQTLWTLRDKTGAALLSSQTAAQLETNTTGQFVRVDDDTIQLDQTGFVGFRGSDPNRDSFTLEASSTGVTDKVSVTKIQDGAVGPTGDDGPPGEDAITVSPASQTYSINCSSNGTPKAEQFNKVITFTVLAGPTDLSDDADTTYTATFTGSGWNGSFGGTNGKVLTLTGITVDAGADLSVLIKRAGATVATVHVTGGKNNDAEAVVVGTTDLTSMPNSSSFAQIGSSVDLSIPSGASMRVDMNAQWQATGVNSYAGEIQVSIENLTDALSPSFSSAVAGDITATASEPATASISGFFLNNSTGATKTFRARAYGRRVSGAGSGPMTSSSMTASKA